MASSVAASLAPKDIEPALAKLRESMIEDNDKVSFGLSSSGNVIIVASGNQSEAQFNEFREAFMSAQPARFFLIELKEKEQPEFSVNAICHRLGKSEHVCSEIISVETPNSYLPRIASVLRSHIAPGALTECCLTDEDSLAKVFSSIMQVPDVVYLDSLKVRSGIKAIGEVAGNTKKLIDLNWLRTAGWRDAIRVGFDAIQYAVSIEDLEKIKIVSIQDKQSPGTSSGSLLIAGWMLSRLGMQLVSVSASAGGKVEFANATPLHSVNNKAPSPRSLSIGFSDVHVDDQTCCTQHTMPGNVYSVELEFGGTRKQTLLLTTNASGNIQVRGEGGRVFSVEHGLSHEVTSAALLRRLLLVGESQKNFVKSLKVAVDIANGANGKL